LSSFSGLLPLVIVSTSFLQQSKKVLRALGGLPVNIGDGMWMPQSATP
jgi:hypothetical protein